MQIKEVDLNEKLQFDVKFAGCIILTADNKILLQYRDESAHTFPGYLSCFGGRVEQNETAQQAIIRELNEELGAIVKKNDLVFLGAVTESATKYTELVYEFFWHDKEDSITGCYEHEARYFGSVDEVLSEDKLMDDVKWSLKRFRLRIS